MGAELCCELWLQDIVTLEHNPPEIWISGLSKRISSLNMYILSIHKLCNCGTEDIVTYDWKPVSYQELFSYTHLFIWIDLKCFLQLHCINFETRLSDIRGPKEPGVYLSHIGGSIPQPWNRRSGMQCPENNFSHFSLLTLYTANCSVLLGVTSRLTMAAVRHTARLNTDLRENILTMAALVTLTLSVAVGSTDHYHGQLSRSGDWTLMWLWARYRLQCSCFLWYVFWL